LSNADVLHAAFSLTALPILCALPDRRAFRSKVLTFLFLIVRRIFGLRVEIPTETVVGRSAGKDRLLSARCPRAGRAVTEASAITGVVGVLRWTVTATGAFHKAAALRRSLSKAGIARAKIKLPEK
jgi:hypothetical protein